MSKLEDIIYSKAVIDGAVLSVTSTDACFKTYGKRREFCLPDLFDKQDLQLEKYPYLKFFLTDNQSMELGYNFSQRLFYVSLYFRKSSGERIDYAEGFDFSSIFETLEGNLNMKQSRRFDRKVKNRLLNGGSFEISGTPKVNGIYIYEEEQIKSIVENEFDMEYYLLSNGCDFLYQTILGGKIVEVRFFEQQFLLEFFSLTRKSYVGPFYKKVEKYLNGDRLLSCLKILNNELEEEMVLSRKK